MPALTDKVKRAHQAQALKNIVAYVDGGGTDLKHIREMADVALPEKTTARELPKVGQWSEGLQEKLRQRDEWKELTGGGRSDR